MDGWRCPGCGRCYSPSATQCLYCGPGAMQYGSSVSGSMQAMRCGRCGAPCPVGEYHLCPYMTSGLTFGSGDSNGLAVNSDNQILITNPADGSGVVLHTEG